MRVLRVSYAAGVGVMCVITALVATSTPAVAATNINASAAVRPNMLSSHRVVHYAKSGDIQSISYVTQVPNLRQLGVSPSQLPPPAEGYLTPQQVMEDYPSYTIGPSSYDGYGEMTMSGYQSNGNDTWDVVATVYSPAVLLSEGLITQAQLNTVPDSINPFEPWSWDWKGIWDHITSTTTTIWHNLIKPCTTEAITGGPFGLAGGQVVTMMMYEYGYIAAEDILRQTPLGLAFFSVEGCTFGVLFANY